MKKNIGKGLKKISISLVIISLIQLFILLVFPFSQGYFLGSSFKEVSAEESTTSYCCPETKEGAICQDILPGERNECAVNALPASCNNVEECKTGCCIDSEEGLCTSKATQAECDSLGGSWEDDSNCLVEECQKSCCVLGDEVKFTTDTRCEKLSADYGFEKDFRQIGGELECLSLAASQEEGACMFSGGSCQRLTEKSCLEKGGEFSEGYLCTSSELNTSCKPSNQTTCKQKKDEVYFVDSCGNLGNIYDSSRLNDDSYWEKIVSKKESCNAGSSNIDSEGCGNCDKYLGSTCANVEDTGSNINLEQGDNYCTNLNCPDAPDVVDAKGNVLKTKNRKNGESWCAYDSQIGEGLDTVGSRHWKYSCNQGQVITEGCSDYRGQICFESTTKEDGKSFTQASCKANRWSECISYNNKVEGEGNNKDYSKVKDACNDNSDCYLKNLNFGKKYNFYQCLPKYPVGFDLSNGGSSESAEKTCSIADFKCTKVIEKGGAFSSDKCVAGCECDSKTYTQQMNDWCKSLGDCGGYVNIVGEEHDGYSSNAPNINLNQYSENINPEEDSIEVSLKDFEDFMGQVFGGSTAKLEQEQAEESAEFNGMLTMAGTVSGALGVMTAAGLSMASADGFSIKGTMAIMKGGGAEGTLSSVASGLSSAAIGAGIGAAVGQIAVMIFGLEGSEANSVIGGFTLGGAAAGIASAMGAGLAAGAVSFGIGFIIGALIGSFFGGGIKKTTYNFECQTYQPSTENQKCSACNDNPLKPCTEYKCNSLGAACHLINENSENPECVKTPDDGTPPKISPGKIEEGYSFFDKENKSIEIKPDSGNCIPEFTEVNFTLNTDEHSQCKMSLEKDENFDDMEEYFGDSSLFLKEHENTIIMPSISSLEVYNVSGDIRKKYGNMNLNVRCQDVNGNKNIQDYSVKFCVETGPDRTAPRIKKIIPSNNSYIKYGQNSKLINIFLNEPAECKYSYLDENAQEKSYDEMENSMNCSTGLSDVLGQGWPCSANLTNMREKESPIKHVIKCKDQPWLKNTENASKRNSNSEGFINTIRKTEKKLKISSISPSPGTEMDAGYTPYPVDLEVTTIGGVNSGNSECEYKFSENGSYSSFYNTGGNKHEQTFDKIMSEDYEVFVKCEDQAGNIVENKTDFHINIDKEPPEVIRAFNTGSSIKIITNEDAKCYYNFQRSHFKIDSNSSKDMSVGFSKEHTAKTSDNTYYIKCKDVWGRYNDGSAIILKPINMAPSD